MTTQNDISLSSALGLVTLSPGAAANYLGWLALQVGHDTEAGAALRDAASEVGEGIPTSRDAKASTSKAG